MGEGVAAIQGKGDIVAVERVLGVVPAELLRDAQSEGQGDNPVLHLDQLRVHKRPLEGETEHGRVGPDTPELLLPVLHRIGVESGELQRPVDAPGLPPVVREAAVQRAPGPHHAEQPARVGPLAQIGQGGLPEALRADSRIHRHCGQVLPRPAVVLRLQDNRPHLPHGGRVGGLGNVRVEAPVYLAEILPIGQLHNVAVEAGRPVGTAPVVRRPVVVVLGHIELGPLLDVKAPEVILRRPELPAAIALPVRVREDIGIQQQNLPGVQFLHAPLKIGVVAVRDDVDLLKALPPVPGDKGAQAEGIGHPPLAVVLVIELCLKVQGAAAGAQEEGLNTLRRIPVVGAVDGDPVVAAYDPRLKPVVLGQQLGPLRRVVDRFFSFLFHASLSF